MSVMVKITAHRTICHHVYYHFNSFSRLSTFGDGSTTMITLTLPLLLPPLSLHYLHYSLTLTLLHHTTPHYTTLHLQLDQVLDLEIYPLPRVSPAYLVYPTSRPPKVQGPSRGDGVLRAQQMI